MLFFKVDVDVSLIWTISKKHSHMKPSLSTNLKIIAICSLLDSSSVSSTIMKNFKLPISSQIASHTLDVVFLKQKYINNKLPLVIGLILVG
jgi:hypothetical protein